MLDVFFAVAIIGLLVILGRQRLTPVSAGIDLTDKEDDDLPCPWCHSPTQEFDERCPTCQRRFG